MTTKPPDFKVSGLRAERIIASGSSSNPRLLLIGSGAAGNEGVTVDTDDLVLEGAGTDTWLFISGSSDGNDKVTFGGNVFISGTTEFKNDLVVSGTLYAERIVVEVDESTTGSLLVSGSLFVSQSAIIKEGLIVNASEETDIENNFTVFSGQGAGLTSIKFDVTNQRLSLSGSATTIGSSNSVTLGTDTNLFVNGVPGSKDSAVKGTSTFGGDVVISGTLHGGSPLKIGTSAGITGSIALKTQIAAPTAGSDEAVLYVLNDGGTKKLYWKNSDDVQNEIGTGGTSEVTGTFNDLGASFITTASVSLAGDLGFSYEASNVGSDVYFFVSGSDVDNRAVFGGDVVISGSIKGNNIVKIQNPAVITGTLSLKANPIVPTVGTNEAMLYVFDDAGTKKLYWKNSDDVAREVGSGGVSEVTGTFNDLGASFITTASVSLAGNNGASFEASNADAKAFVFISGSRSQITTANLGTTGLSAAGATSLFVGGDVVFSGSIHGRSLDNAGNKSLDFASQNVYFRKTGKFAVGSQLGGAPGVYPTSDPEVIFSVSGSIDSKNSGNPGVSLFGGDLFVSGSMITDHAVLNKITTHNSNFNVDSTMHIMLINPSSHVTASLQNPLVAGSGRILTFKDISGNASINNIVVDGYPIDGASSFKILTDYGAVTLMCNGSTSYHIIGTR